MSWATRFELRQYLKGSAWVLPLLGGLLGTILAQVTNRIVGWRCSASRRMTGRGSDAERGVPFVLATRNDDMLVSPDGHRRQAKVLATIAGTASQGWERRSVGLGAHGPREYDWTAVALDTAGLPAGWGH
jgi:hypothetical protein